MWEVGNVSNRMARPATSMAVPNAPTAAFIVSLLETLYPGGVTARPPPPRAAASFPMQNAVVYTPTTIILNENDVQEEPVTRAISRTRSLARCGCRDSEKGLERLEVMKNRTIQAKNEFSAAASTAKGQPVG